MDVESTQRQGGVADIPRDSAAAQIDGVRAAQAVPQLKATKKGTVIIPKRVFLNESYKTLIVEYAASGANPKQISQQLGLTLVRVQETLNDPKIQVRIHAKIANGPLPRIQEFLGKELVSNFLFLREVRENKKAPVRERVQAALKLIEYTVGQAKQPIFNDAKDLKSYTLEQIAPLIDNGPEEPSAGTIPN